MQQVYIDNINKDSEFSEGMFQEICECTDKIERTKYIEKVRRKCKPLGRLREFNALLRAYNSYYNKLHSSFSRGGAASENHCTQFTNAPLELQCGSYLASDDGIFTNEFYPDGSTRSVLVCPHPLLLAERMVNIETDTEKVKILFRRDNQWREIVADCNVIMNKTNITRLSDRGVLVSSESAKDMVNYMYELLSLNATVIPVSKSIGHLGWVNGEFAPYAGNIKYDGDMEYQSIYDHVTENGDFFVWLDHISDLRENICIRLMLDASFASVLLEPLGLLPFVFHMWGTTGFGKTVSLMIVSSIWGNPEMGCLTRSMNMTANAMVRTAAFLRNIPFCADELQQMKDRWSNYDSLIMFITEGIDKGRAKAAGGVEILRTWKNSFIFTGEEPITKAISGGGVKNRTIEIEVKEQIILDGNKTANLVKQNYGHAGKQFIRYIQLYMKEKGIKAMLEEYRSLQKKILAMTDTTEKQAMAMSIMLFADKLSCECIFGGEPLEGADIKDYLISVKTVDVAERAYDWTVNWIAENSIRFIDDVEQNKGSVWGKIQGDIAIINKNVLERALQEAGFDYTVCSRKWAERGQIIKNSQGKIRHQTKVAGLKASYIKLILNDIYSEFQNTDQSFEQCELPLE